MVDSRVLTTNKANGSYVTDRAYSSVNKEGDTFCFTAYIEDDYDLKVGDGVLFAEYSYEVVEISKTKKKQLTTFYAKIT